MKDKDMLSDLIDPGFFNSIFNERLDKRDGKDYVSEVAQAFLQKRLKEIAPGLFLYNTEVEKIANRIQVSYLIRNKYRPRPERYYSWEITEQELLADDKPVTSLFDARLREHAVQHRAWEKNNL